MAHTATRLAAALIALAVATTAASAFDIKAGGEPKLKATKIQLGIISPADNVCPGNGKMTAWVFSNKPGTVPILIVRDNGTVAGPYQVETVKGANGLSIGTWTQNLAVANAINAEYRVVTPGSDVASNWVPLKAQC